MKKDSRLADTWLMGQQLAADGTPLYGTYDKMGEPLIYTKDIPSGIIPVSWKATE